MVTREIKLCDYGCGKEAKYQFKNGKWCCSQNVSQCPYIIKKQLITIQNRTPKEKEKISKKFKGKNNPAYGTKCYWDGKVGPRKGMKNTKIANKKRSITMKNTQKNSNNNNWKGGYASKDIATYDQYSEKLSHTDEVRRNKKDTNILEVKCAYCGKWIIPTMMQVVERIRSLDHFGDTKIYCSTTCIEECPIYRKVKYPKGFKIDSSREVQPELRQMRFKIDNFTCQKCNKHQDELDVGLHCHHLEGIRWEPIESADVDKCITLCKTCHIEVHKKEGCKYHEYRCPEEYQDIGDNFK